MFKIAGINLLFLIVVGGMLPLGVFAQDRDLITWAKVDLPPSHIIEGPHAGTGPADLLINLMIDRLSQYTHQIKVFPNFTRLTAELAEGNHICSALYLYNPPGHKRREQWLVSAPNAIFYDFHIIVRIEDRHLYGDVASFEEIIKNKDLTFGQMSGTGYSPEVGEILSKELGVKDILALSPEEQLKTYNKAPNIFTRTGSDMVTGLLKMLVSGRLDYLFMAPSSAGFYSESLDELRGKIAMIPVKEGSRVGVLSYACPSTDWGQQVISDINGVLKTARTTPEYRKLMQRYVTSKDLEDAYWKFYQEKVISVLE